MNSTRLACAVAVFTHAGCNFSFAPRRLMKTLTLTLLLACACRGGTGPESCVSDCWTTKAPLATPRHHLAVGVVNGVLYAVGGYGGYYGPPLNVVEAYNPVANAWATKAPMPTPRGISRSASSMAFSTQSEDTLGARALATRSLTCWKVTTRSRTPGRSRRRCQRHVRIWPSGS